MPSPGSPPGRWQLIFQVAAAVGEMLIAHELGQETRSSGNAANEQHCDKLYPALHRSAMAPRRNGFIKILNGRRYG